MQKVSRTRGHLCITVRTKACDPGRTSFPFRQKWKDVRPKGAGRMSGLRTWGDVRPASHALVGRKFEGLVKHAYLSDMGL
jgi:hypothetical protein